VQWLRDRMKIIQDSSQTESHARELVSNDGVFLVPAFVGLGAPYWNPNARGAIFGLTRDTGPEHFSRAALESIAYQTYDLIQAMSKDTSYAIDVLRVDGGMVANQWMCQMLADILNIDIEIPKVTETTALGAAYLAGLQAGLFDSTETISQLWLKASTFKPEMEPVLRVKLLKQWQLAVDSVDNMGKARL
jgi:glycerol kinase